MKSHHQIPLRIQTQRFRWKLNTGSLNCESGTTLYIIKTHYIMEKQHRLYSRKWNSTSFVWGITGAALPLTRSKTQQQTQQQTVENS